MESLNIIIAALFLLIVIYIIAQVALKPIKLLWKILLNSAIGMLLLLLTNYFGAFIDINIPINLLTVLIAGFLGIPGVVLLICFTFLIA
ncbi:MAG TPA: pro-sigmaK processing inhibitor BofA family protein [Syntrophomonadaceae bacterium]|nr:pro-sigmaK processing inhibitor BofA family protein [Syntrophomonadaceae bacterium]HNX29883.1 pro-sigmaK processing inhibitor BofA family protein [Syntrophomonadaceae bacterium]HPR93938.1 pro-sigmaK processing inhibitor BofA family protein [Syntrophomonadaceae bacterium]